VSARERLLAEVTREMPGHAAAAVRLNIAIAHRTGMHQADGQCLGLLADGPSAPSKLAERLGLTTGAMTKVLDRLERDGYVTRTPDPDDRRRVIVHAEPRKLAELGQVYAAMGQRMADYLADRTEAELRTILSFMRAGIQAAEAEIDDIRSHGVRHATRTPRPIDTD
jgi:DNA-binding MarR family transcriptional regulator